MVGGEEWGMPINMSVMRYRKVSSYILNTIVLKLLKISRRGKYCFQTYYVHKHKQQCSGKQVLEYV